MKLTPTERRERIRQLAASDPEISKMKKEYDEGRAWFEKATASMSPKRHSQWWTFPGMAHFIHHRLLTLICENMKFNDED